METEESREAEDSKGRIETQDDSSFVWDDTSQLYFHARSGFYHDPNAGWYYSSRDGLYYKFENGSYVLLDYDHESKDDHESHTFQQTTTDNIAQENSSVNLYCNKEDQSDVCHPSSELVTSEGHTECSTNPATEIPRPPSEWLEETLINLFLPGNRRPSNSADASTIPLEVDGGSRDDSQIFEGGDQISENHHCLTSESESITNQDVCKDEENWLAQYGQVVHSGEQLLQDLNVVDLWDWAVALGSREEERGHTARLVGRLVKRSVKLHPSMSSSGGRFRTAPICEVSCNLVRVRTGQVYKLHSPSAEYLATLSSYDSSNPTKGWGFPELSINARDKLTTKSFKQAKLNNADSDNDVAPSANELSTSKKQRIYEYRDRASERRTLHGGFGVGPGQKISSDDAAGTSSPVSISTEEAAAEALNMSFGADSYARKILKNMGWKEGEALGNIGKGLIEPIEAVGNVGNAGLGWSQSRTTE